MPDNCFKTVQSRLLVNAIKVSFTPLRAVIA
jgi:hypothetical protein